jgi:hypothetical protein
VLRLQAGLRVDHHLRFDRHVEQSEHRLEVAGLLVVDELRGSVAQLRVQSIDDGIGVGGEVLDRGVIDRLIERAGAPLLGERHRDRGRKRHSPGH